MPTDEIDRSRWLAFLEGFGRQHRRWLVTMERTDPDGRHETLAHEVPLESIGLSREGDVVTFFGGRGKAGPQKEKVKSPMRILLEVREDGAHEGLRIEQSNGGITDVRFRTSAHPEQLNGIITG